MKKNLLHQQFNLILSLSISLLLFNCASTPQQTLSPNTFEPSNSPNYNQPQSNVGFGNPQSSFMHNLPLGIGGRFDLFVSETATEVNDFYQDYLAPMRNGNVFMAKPYVVNYAIMPSSGDIYKLDNELHDKTVKSDYDFRVGMTRRYSSVSDFFKTDFWIAKGKYGPEQSHKKVRSEQQNPFDLEMFGQTHAIQSNEPYVEPEFDVNEILNSDWDLPVDMQMAE